MRVEGFRCSLTEAESSAVRAAASAAAAVLPDLPNTFPERLPGTFRNQLRAVASPADEFGFRVFDVFPAGSLGPLPDSPTGERPTLPETDWTAAMLFLVADYLGGLVGYEDEKGGALVHDVCPVPGKETFIENVGADHLGLHTENVHHPLRPDHVALFCLRADHDGVAALRVAPVRPALDGIPADLVPVLREPRFHSLYPTSFGLDGTGRRPCSAPHPVLGGPAATPTIRFNTHNTTGLDEAAESARRLLDRRLDETSVRLKLRPGQLAVLNNNFVVHGRTPFRPRYDGRDRWLRRCYAIRAVPDVVRAAMPRPRVLPRTARLLGLTPAQR
ncbi:TauD/TfdA family dioxygenase [Amycolatopsis sp. lyj-23]|uniref:TauD/TfdA family dioxygenase n=1 Tax=Amycolatopsis sp. lyj-23 TaxID=2789283 RepID=UPI00397B46C4